MQWLNRAMLRLHTENTLDREEKIMSEWLKTSLIDIVELIGGGTPKTSKAEYWGGNINWLSVKDFNNENRYVYSTEKTITEEGLNNSSTKLLRKDDIIISARGTVGELSMIPFPMAFNQSCYGIRAKEGIDSTFLYYLIKHSVRKLKAMTHGSVFDTITRDTFANIDVAIPDIEMQQRVAKMLANIDDKVENNQRINNNLEQQAKTLFKSWFVDFEPFDESFVDSPIGTKIPHSLQMVQIGSLSHILETGKRPKGGAVATGVPSIGAENVKRLGEVNFASAKYIPVEFAQKMDKGKVHGYELMLYKDGGKPGTFIPHFSMFGEGFPYDDFYINEHVFKLDFGDKGFNEFCYFYLQTDYPYNWLANNGGKAAVPGINQQDVNSIWIYHPDNPIVKEYCKWVQPIFTTILRNCSQNVKLSQLRDALLPKLMSGELDVSDIEI
jgi:type I restriction enzyme S subunit